MIYTDDTIFIFGKGGGKPPFFGFRGIVWVKQRGTIIVGPDMGDEYGEISERDRILTIYGGWAEFIHRHFRGINPPEKGKKHAD